MEEKLAQYIRTVARQSHESEHKDDSGFYLQAWLVNDKDLAVLAWSPYLRVLRKTYYRLMQNVYRNFGVRFVETWRIIRETREIPCEHLAPLMLHDYAAPAMAIGKIEVPVMDDEFYLATSPAKPDYLDYLPPSFRNMAENPGMHWQVMDQFDLSLRLEQLPGFYQKEDGNDPLSLAREACRKITGFVPPELEIREILSIVPADTRRIKIK